MIYLFQYLCKDVRGHISCWNIVKSDRLISDLVFHEVELHFDVLCPVREQVVFHNREATMIVNPDDTRYISVTKSDLCHQMSELQYLTRCIRQCDELILESRLCRQRLILASPTDLFP